jgi:GntR family transcriptional regulator, phosphonate transport system regulatory protein
MTEPIGGVALWRRIETTLAAEIAAGLFKPGDRLPTEAELARRFAVNRHTLRRAMAALADAGRVRIEQGRGTFVQEDVIEYPVSRRTRFSEVLTAQHYHPRGELLRAVDLPASAEVARGLKIRGGQRVIVLEIVGHADSRPISLVSHYFPRARFDGLIDSYKATRSITKALVHHGVADYVRLETRATTRMPDDVEARILKQSPRLPILVTESINIDTDGRHIEFSIGRFASERVQIVFKP